MITLLTEPSLYPWFQLFKFLKNALKRLAGKKISPYSGHFGVMRSIVTGLSENDILFDYNPAYLKYRNVHVFGNISALKMAIFFKRIGVIKYLSAGPNIVVSSTDNNGILASKYIDKVILNSEWIKEVYLLDNDKLIRDKIVLWPSGVDVNYWKVTKKLDKQPNFLLYIKRPEFNILNDCIAILKKNEIKISFINYGKYNIEELKEAVAIADCAVFFVEQESQGLALLEIWASDTPTFVWNPQIWHHNGKNYKCSSAPYLTEQTGKFFTSQEEFRCLISDFKSGKFSFNPREYSIAHFSDKVSAKDFLEKVSKI